MLTMSRVISKWYDRNHFEVNALWFVLPKLLWERSKELEVSFLLLPDADTLLIYKGSIVLFEIRNTFSHMFFNQSSMEPTCFKVSFLESKFTCAIFFYYLKTKRFSHHSRSTAMRWEGEKRCTTSMLNISSWFICQTSHSNKKIMQFCLVKSASTFFYIPTFYS